MQALLQRTPWVALSIPGAISVPILFIAGHNDKSEFAIRDSKEIPFRELFGPVTKWCAVIERPDQVAPILRRAFMHLTSGRPGPVVVGMPYDVLVDGA